MGDNKQEQSIARFIANECANKDVTRFVLRHVTAKGKGVEVETFDIIESIDADTCRMLAGSIYGRAQMDADGYGSAVQRYMLFSYVKGQDTASSRVPFRCKGEVDMELDEDESEDAPTNRGLLSQLMRHNENNNRTLVAATQALTVGMARQIDSKDKTIERLLADRERMMELIEEAQTANHERAMESMRETKKQERIDWGMKKAGLLAPIAISYLTDGKMGSDASPVGAIVKDFMESLDAKQFEALQKVLSPEQLIAVMRLYEMMRDAKKKEGDSNGVS